MTKVLLTCQQRPQHAHACFGRQLISRDRQRSERSTVAHRFLAQAFLMEKDNGSSRQNWAPTAAETVVCSLTFCDTNSAGTQVLSSALGEERHGKTASRTLRHSWP